MVKPKSAIALLRERVDALEADNRFLRKCIDDMKALLVKPERDQCLLEETEPKAPLSDVFEINRRIAISKSKSDRYVFNDYELSFLKDTLNERRPTQKQRLFMDGLAKKPPQLRATRKPDWEYPSSHNLGGYGSGRHERDPLYREGDGKGSDWDLADEMLPDLGAHDGESPLITMGSIGFPASRHRGCLGYADGGYSRFAAAVGDYGGGSYIADRDNSTDLGLYGDHDSDYEDDRFSID